MNARARDLAKLRSRGRLPGVWFALACAVLVLMIVLFPCRPTLAQVPQVPADLQADLLSKLVNYDRSFKTRAGDVALVLLLVQPGNAKSDLAASSMKAALSRLDALGHLPHRETILPYDSAASVASRCRSERVAIIYVSVGFENEIAALRSALVGIDVLTVSAVPEYVQLGIVLGFELEAGRSRMSLNYPQAKLQHVDFRSDVLKLMRIYE